MEEDMNLARSRVAEHQEFFDALAELVPSKYYLPGEDETRYYHSKKEKLEARKKFKEMAKESKMKKLDPDEIKTLEEMQIEEEQRRLEDRSKQRGTGFKGSEEGMDAVPSKVQKEDVGFEELRGRLQERIQQLRAKRKAEQRTKTKESALRWRTEKRRQSAERAKKTNGMERTDSVSKALQNGHVEGDGMGKESNRGEDDAQLQFSNVNLPEPEWEKRKRIKKNKQSKELLLEKAVALKEDLKKSEHTAEGKEKAKKVAMESAYLRATGQKVLDDPKLLRRSIKREQREKLKSAQAWSERNRRVEEAKQAKQQKRSTNLRARRDAKIEHKIAKREKKLSRRPGFEGEIKGFVNDS